MRPPTRLSDFARCSAFTRRSLAVAAASLPFAFALACGSSTPPATTPPVASASSASEVAPIASASTTAAATASTSTAPTDRPPQIVGGACTYAKQVGMCEITAGATFTFKGVVDGASVVLTGNALAPMEKSPALGTSAPCTIEFITTGTCTPCMFSVGTCGRAALDAFRKHK